MSFLFYYYCTVNPFLISVKVKSTIGKNFVLPGSLVQKTCKSYHKVLLQVIGHEIDLYVPQLSQKVIEIQAFLDLRC